MDLKKLKEKREEKHLSQMDAASLCGVSLNAYIRWEKGCSKPKPINEPGVKKILE